MMTCVPLIGAWTFTSIGMLFWGLAAAIPILLHLWNRRRFQETSWAAMDFLLAAVRKNARRLQFEQLFLLLLRVLILVTFSLALADPLLSWQSRTPASNLTQTAHIFVVDTTYSMAFKPRDRTRLDAAQEVVTRMLDASQDGDGFLLLLMQNPPQPLVAEVSFDRSELRQHLANLQLSDGGADLKATLLATQKLVENVRRRYSQFEHIRVHFVSDAGRNTWGDAGTADCRALFGNLGKVAQLALIDVSAEPTHNVAVVNLRAERAAAFVGDRLRLEAELQDLGLENPSSVHVDFFVDGHMIDSQDVTITSGGRAIAATNHLFGTPGDAVLEVRIGPDALPIDNQRWGVVSVRKNMRVLAIQGEPQAADYVALALNPERSVESPIQVEIAPESALQDDSLFRYDCVMLNNVSRISFDEANILSRYVADGGGLVLSLGDQVTAENYNRELVDGNRLLPAKIDQIVRGEHFFDPKDYKHSLIAPFLGHERAGLLTVPTWTYFRLRPLLSEKAEVALSYDNGDAAIVIETIGRGRCVLVGTALSPTSVDQTAEGIIPWTALPTWPSFPPLVHGLVREATSGTEADRNLVVGSPLSITVPQAVPSAQISMPDEKTQRLSFPASNAARATFTGTQRRGVYTASFPDTEIAPQRFAVNVDVRESNLERVSLGALPPEIDTQLSAESGEVTAPIDDRISLFRVLLGVVALLLLTESLMATWFARRQI